MQELDKAQVERERAERAELMRGVRVRGKRLLRRTLEEIAKGKVKVGR